MLIFSFSYYQRMKKLNEITVVKNQKMHDYQLIQLGDFRRDQFLIDKNTGRVWNKVCSGDVKGADCDGELMFEEMAVSGRELTDK